MWDTSEPKGLPKNSTNTCYIRAAQETVRAIISDRLRLKAGHLLQGQCLDVCSLGDGVGVQIHTADVSWGHIEVKVSGVHPHDKRTRRAEHIGQGQRTQRDVRTGPVEGEDHLSARRKYYLEPHCEIQQSMPIIRNKVCLNCRLITMDYGHVCFI